MIAIATGWAAAAAATLPLQFVKIYRDEIGGLGSLLWSFAAGALIWGLWSLAIAAGGWLSGGLPMIAFIREPWLLRHPRRSVAICAGLGWSVVLIKFKVWELRLPGHILDVRTFIVYSLLLVVYAVVSAAVYLRLIARMGTSPQASASLHRVNLER